MTKFTKEELFELARQAGERLFSTHRSGLIFPDSAKSCSFGQVKLSEHLADGIEMMGIDDDGLSPAYVDDFEFTFFPSRPGEGLDNSCCRWAYWQPEWRDVDGPGRIVVDID